MALIHNLIARFRADTGAFDRNVNKSRQQMTRFGRDMQRVSRQLLAIGGGYMIVNRAVRGAIRAFMEQENAERALIAATNQNIDSFKKYAAGIQKVTIYGDEQILSQMAYAKNLGVSTDKLEEATTAAVGLAAKYRLELATAMMLVGRASQGQTQMLTRYGIALKESLSAQEKFNTLLKIGAENFRLAEAETETLEGAWKRFKNAASDFGEEIVGAYVDVIKGLGQVIDHYKGVEKSAESAHEEMKRIKEVMPSYQTNMPGAFWYPAPTKPKLPELSKEEQEWLAFMEKQRKANESMRQQVEQQNEERAQAAEISEKYLNRVQEEIALTGHLGEARQHAAQIIKLQSELEKAGIKNTFAAKEAVEQLRGELTKLEKAQKLARIAETIGDSFASAFEKMIFEAEKFRDVMRSVARDIGVSVFRNLITQPIANQITMALGGVPATVGHAGGIVGQIGRKRNVPALAFAGAPRLHGGLAPDEYPSILQRGERVIPKGQNAFGVTIINESGDRTQLRPTTEPIFDGRKAIIRVAVEDINSGGLLRKTIKGIR